MPTCSRLNNSLGMTLLELMVTLGIVGILAAIAIPAYNQFMKKAKMVEGELAIHNIEKLQQNYFLETGTYTNNLGALGYSPVPPLKYYTMAITLGDNQPIAYQATATANTPDLGSFLLIKYGDGRADYLQVSTNGSGSGGSGSGGSGGDSGGSGSGSGGGDSGSGDSGGGKDKKDKDKDKKDKKDK
jgi:type IV pilus assembly protein PilE